MLRSHWLTLSQGASMFDAIPGLKKEEMFA